MKFVYSINGLDCASCAAKIEKKLKNMNGIDNVKLDFLGKKLIVKSDFDMKEDITRVIQAIEGEVTLNQDKTNKSEKIKSLFFITGLIFFAISFFLPKEISPYFYAISYLTIGYDIIIKGIKNIFAFNSPDENMLMLIASAGAIFIGEFPEAVAVLLFYKVGEFFQDKAVEKSRSEITSLMNIKIDYANKIVDNSEIKVKPEELTAGDIIIIKPGEKIPVDCKIIKGETELDTKALTGESNPEFKRENDFLISGTINLTNAIHAKVEKSYSNSTVAKILDLIENSTEEKTKTENFITSFAKYYTPFVIILAFIITVIPPIFAGFDKFSDYLYKGLMLLVVSCPCALVLSVPLSYFSGIGAASKNKILIKGSNYIDILSKLETVMFDKTGTLTEGKFKIKKINPVGISAEDLIKIAAHGESNSNHPLAKAITESYKEKTDKNLIEEFQEIPGKGIKTKYKGKELLIGNGKLCKNIATDLNNTSLYIIYDGNYIGSIEFEDRIKSNCENTIKELKKAKIKTVMLSGDKGATALEVGNKIGIDKIYYELLPEDKVNKIREEKRNSKKYVAFVGDGINDAPSLNIADIGISMGSLGSDAAIASSDIVFMNDDISLITKGINIARKTRKIVIENIAFSLTFKFTVLILCMLSVTNMWTAVIADVGVSLIAVVNSLRLLFFYSKGAEAKCF